MTLLISVTSKKSHTQEIQITKDFMLNYNNTYYSLHTFLMDPKDQRLYIDSNNQTALKREIVNIIKTKNFTIKQAKNIFGNTIGNMIHQNLKKNTNKIEIINAIEEELIENKIKESSLKNWIRRLGQLLLGRRAKFKQAKQEIKNHVEKICQKINNGTTTVNDLSD